LSKTPRDLVYVCAHAESNLNCAYVCTQLTVTKPKISFIRRYMATFNFHYAVAESNLNCAYVCTQLTVTKPKISFIYIFVIMARVLYTECPNQIYCAGDTERNFEEAVCSDGF